MAINDMDPIAITSPFYPKKESMVENFMMDDVQYIRCKHPVNDDNNLPFNLNFIRKSTFTGSEDSSQLQSNSGKNIFKMSFDFVRFGILKIGRLIRKPLVIPYRVFEERALMKHFEKSIIETCKQNKIQIIHAHTPYRVGLPALRAARKLSIPFVYEMRGLWEETAVANGRWRRNGLAYARYRRLENKVLKSADAIIVISEGLRQSAIARNVPSEDIILIPNSTEKSSQNVSKPQNYTSIKGDLDSLEGETTIGYIGSLRPLEGVDNTAFAVSKLVEQGHDVKLFCLTGHDGQEDLRKLCDKVGLQNRHLITGPVPHSDVGAYYDLIDIFVVSRPDFEVTRLVTPLKPFEAMGRGRAIVVTNLPALIEIVEHEVTGLVTKSNSIDSLVSSIEHFVNDKTLRAKLGAQAKEWVEEHRLWEIVVSNLTKAYEIAEKRNNRF